MLFLEAAYVEAGVAMVSGARGGSPAEKMERVYARHIRVAGLPQDAKETRAVRQRPLRN